MGSSKQIMKYLENSSSKTCFIKRPRSARLKYRLQKHQKNQQRWESNFATTGNKLSYLIGLIEMAVIIENKEIKGHAKCNCFKLLPKETRMKNSNLSLQSH